MVVVQSQSHVQLFAIPRTVAGQAALSFTVLDSTQIHVHGVGDRTEASHAPPPFSNSFPVPSRPQPDEGLSDHSLTKLPRHHVGLPLVVPSRDRGRAHLGLNPRTPSLTAPAVSSGSSPHPGTSQNSSCQFRIFSFCTFGYGLSHRCLHQGGAFLDSPENSVTAGHSLLCLWGQEPAWAASVLSYRVGEVWVPQWSGAPSASQGGLGGKRLW